MNEENFEVFCELFDELMEHCNTYAIFFCMRQFPELWREYPQMCYVSHMDFDTLGNREISFVLSNGTQIAMPKKYMFDSDYKQNWNTESDRLYAEWCSKNPPDPSKIGV